MVNLLASIPSVHGVLSVRIEIPLAILVWVIGITWYLLADENQAALRRARAAKEFS